MLAMPVGAVHVLLALNLTMHVLPDWFTVTFEELCTFCAQIPDPTVAAFAIRVSRPPSGNTTSKPRSKERTTITRAVICSTAPMDLSRVRTAQKREVSIRPLKSLELPADYSSMGEFGRFWSLSLLHAQARDRPGVALQNLNEVKLIEGLAPEHSCRRRF